MKALRLDLKPCPFCGGRELGTGSNCVGHGESEKYIYCVRCYASMPEGYGKSAFQKWEERFDLNPPPASPSG